MEKNKKGNDSKIPDGIYGKVLDVCKLNDKKNNNYIIYYIYYIYFIYFFLIPHMSFLASGASGASKIHFFYWTPS